MKKWFFISVLLVSGLLLSACGGGGSSGPPVDMEQEEASILTMERPEAWKTNSMDMFGITILIASSADIKAESVLEGGDFTQAFQGSPGVLIMAVPKEMAGEGGDFGFSVEDIKNIPKEEADVEIVREGDVTVNGVEGYELVGKGVIEDFGSDKVGVHLAVLERDAGPMVFMGISPNTDLDKNLDIFKFMFESIKFK